MATIYKWRIQCSVHGFVYVWNETEPTQCPVDSTDIIDASKTSIVDKRDPNTIEIKEEHVPTGGNFSIETRTITAGANATETHDHSWPFPINVLQVSFVGNGDTLGDEIELSIAPNTPITTLAQDCASGNTVLYLNSVEHALPGYFLEIGTDELGWIASVDKVAKTVTLANATANSYTAGNIVTRTVKVIKNYTIGHAWKYDIGNSKIGGSYVPANTIVRVIYKNNNATTPKTIYSEIEYLY